MPEAAAPLSAVEAGAAPPPALVDEIRTGRRFLVTSHRNPDGDAIGSSLGMARLLRSLGKEARVWLRDAVPSIYGDLPDRTGLHTGEDPPEDLSGFDRVVMLECPSLERSGLEGALADAGLEGALLNIDHHLGNTGYGRQRWVDTRAAAVGVLVYRLALTLEAVLDPELATLLYLALVSDTGSFRYGNADADAFTTAAALVERGAQPEQVSLWLFESQPVAGVRLLGEMLQTLRLHSGGRLATAELTREMYRNSGAEAGDAEGLIDIPRGIAGVQAVALFKELDPDLGKGGAKVSLRSKGAVDVETVARRFSGGGHRNAAGCTLKAFDEASRNRVIEALEAALKEVTP